MNEAVKKFKENADRIASVAVRTGQTDDLAKILSATILHGLFLSLGKQSSLDTESYSERTLKYLEVLCPDRILKENSATPERILIKLDTKKIPVEELNYEKDVDFLKIMLKGKNILNTDGIVISKERESVDMLILLDTSSDEAEKIISAVPQKDIIKITSKERGLAQKIAGILKAFSQEISKDFANLLWLLLEEENKEAAYPKPENIALYSELESLIDKQKIAGAREAYFDKRFWKVLGRAIERSEFENENSIHWTFLSKTDLSKYGAGKDLLVSIFKEIRNLRKNAKYFALLWETPSANESADRNISAIIGSEKENLVSLASALGTSPASNYFFVHGFRAFSEAEINIRGHLRKLV